MISDFLSERPTEKTIKYLLFFSFPLLIITAYTLRAYAFALRDIAYGNVVYAGDVK